MYTSALVYKYAINDCIDFFGGIHGQHTIRNLDDLKAQLRVVAASHGHSMEEEARLIIRQALFGTKPQVG